MSFPKNSRPKQTKNTKKADPQIRYTQNLNNLTEGSKSNKLETNN